MRVQNNSKRTYQHTTLDKDKKIVTLNLYPGENLEVPDDIAELWLKTGEVIEYVDPQEAKKTAEAAAKKQAALEDENAKLKEQIAKLEAAAKKQAAKK